MAPAVKSRSDDIIEKVLALPVPYGLKEIPLLFAAWIMVLFRHSTNDEERGLVTEQEARGWEERSDVTPRLDRIARRATDGDSLEIIRRARGYRLWLPSEDPWRTVPPKLLQELGERAAVVDALQTVATQKFDAFILAEHRRRSARTERQATEADAVLAVAQAEREDAELAVRRAGVKLNETRQRIDAARRAQALAAK
jgi:hypothetical protein